MVVGIGNDVVYIPRVQGVLAKFPVRFPQKILSGQERALLPVAGGARGQTQFIAGRWAAKEALAKALGRGWRAPLRWHGVSVCRDNLGKPYFNFSADLQTYLQQAGIAAHHVSIAHDGDYALATVVLEQ